MAVKFTRVDLDYILQQILMAEAGQPPVNPLLSFGLRTVDGTGNNLVAGQSTYGSTDQVFPTVTDPLLQNAQFGTSYSSTSGLVIDAQPRMISNLIADQTANNPAAMAAQAQQSSFLGAGYQNNTSAGADGTYGTADDTITRPGADGVYGTADDQTIQAGADLTFGTNDDAITTGAVSADAIIAANLATPALLSSSSSAIAGLPQSLFINNVTPDNGLSAPSNSWFTFFGQFFDHGLDMIDKGGNGTVFIPLSKDDPLYVPGSPTNFMVLTRATDLPGPDGKLGTADDVHQGTNQTSPFIDQSQTYASDPSHQVFLREYMIGADGKLHSTGSMLGHPKADGSDGMATWGDLKANALHFFGIKLTDADVGNVPLLATDAYGNFIPGANGLPQLVVRNADGTTSLIEGNLANPISLSDLATNGVTVLRTGHAFINDMAHAASPTSDFGSPLSPDADSSTTIVSGTAPANSFVDIYEGATLLKQHVLADENGKWSFTVSGEYVSPALLRASLAGETTSLKNVISVQATATAIGLFNSDGTPVVPDSHGAINNYDNELLDAHYVAGDGRVNENIGLTAVQDIFHSEHDRLVAQTKATIQAELAKGDVSFASAWVLPSVDLTVTNYITTASDNFDVPVGTAIHLIADNEWNGERLFQAGKFGTETEYQHLVFEEFARYVAPSIHVAAGVNVHIDPAITSEFANVVYRFGHSMLDENINLYQLGADGKPIIDPTTGQPQMTEEGLIQAFTNPTLFASDSNMTADLVLGTVNQVSNAIDEFVTGSLRNNLLGLPLDLAALNIARGRDTGVAPLNLVRNQLYAETGEAQLKAYANWADFGSQLKHPESLINFIAAYGTHNSILHITDATTGLVRDTTMAERRAAATFLVHHGILGDQFNPADPASMDAYNFMHSLGAYASSTTDSRAIHDAAGNPAAWSTGSVTGVDNIDMWIGGLAEKISLFGGKLGSTFEYIFRTQMEALQDGDRLYYLPRIEGMDYEESLQNSSLAELIRANTKTSTGAELHLPGNVFLTPEYTIEASDYFNADGSIKDPTGATWLRNPQTGKLLVDITADHTLQFLGDDNFLGNTIVMGGTDGNDKLTAGEADDDTIWGEKGDDVINGGGGADFLFGGDGNDTVIGGQGDDIMHGDAGNDTMYGGDGIDNIFGGDGNDYIEGGRGDDIIMGGLGNDIIIGNEGQDELTGGEGDDWLESRGGQGDLMMGDSGAPTGGVPLYSGNDVMIGGVAGGDVMKGFSGDDIMVGGGSFTKFIGGLGFDWGSYEMATHGVSADMNRKEFISPIGAEDAIRDIWQHTEGASGSAFDDVITGTNDTRLLATKDELDNVNLITGLANFFDPGPVSFDGGNILLGGSGNDSIKGGGGNDIIDGDAWLHVALTSYSAGGQIIRQINYDPNGNTYDPSTAKFQLDTNGLVVPGSFVAGTGHVNAANVDTAVYSDVMADYDIALFGKDAEGFLSINHARTGAPIVGGNPQGLLGGNDGTDRIRNIERLQFTDVTVAIDSNGNIISSSLAMPSDPNYATLYAPFYDAVPVGTPTITESGGLDPATTVTVGQTLTASVATIQDYDGIITAMKYQWQELDLLRGEWVDVVGANASTFVPTTFQEGSLGLRVKVSYVDGKGYTETLISAPTATVTFPTNINTAPTLVTGQQFNGISNTTALMGAPFDFFSPFTAIFTDAQTAANALKYSATLADGSSLASAGMTFTFDPVTGSAEFKAPNGLIDPDGNLIAAGQLAVRVTATDSGPGTPLSVTNTFFINILPLDTPPVANNDSYSILENGTLSIAHAAMGPSATVTPPNTVGVLANDTDADLGDRLTAQLISGPSHGTLQFNKDGTFVYTPILNYNGVDSFTYVANDAFLKSSNVATATITVNPAVHVVTAALLNDTGVSATDGITNDATLGGKGFANAAVFASVDGAAPVQFATADATGAWSGKPIIADGFHTIVVSETNASGRTDFATVSFTLDTTPPPASVGLVADTGASNTDGVTNNPALTGIGDLNSTVSVVIDGGAATAVPTNAAGIWSLPEVDPVSGTPLLADGSHTVVVTGNTDIAGNTKVATLTFTLDTIPPAVTEKLLHDTGALATDNVTNDATITGSGDPGAAVFASIDGAASVAVATALADGSWSFKPALADGNHTVVISETDLAGNTGTASLAFSLDTTPPPVTVALLSDTGKSATDGITKIATLTGTGDPNTAANPNAAVLVSIDGNAAGSIFTDANGRWTFTPTVADGLHTVSVSETDLAGNTTTKLMSFTLDTVAPATPTITAFSATPNAGQTALTSYTISGTAESGSTVTLSNGTTLGTVTAAANGSWTFTVTPTPASNFSSTLAVTATDLAGNASAAQSRGLIVGNGAANTLSAAGTSVPSLLLGLAANDSLVGGAGDDTLNGGTGNDTMSGGAGSDTYIVDAIGDVVTEQPNAGTDTVLTSLTTYTLATNVENLTFTGTGSFTGIGNGSANIITGGAGADTLTAVQNVSGGDTLIGGAGNDTYNVVNAGDIIMELAGGGTDTVRSTSGNYTLGANVENLTFTGSGNFIGTGNSSANVITGGAGADILTDGLNAPGVADTLIGGAGNDIYVVNNAADTITDTNGVDTVQTTLNTYSIASNVALENLTFIGTGNFTGAGNIAANVITGGSGNDTLTGGAGADTFVFNTGFGKDVITDFTAGTVTGHDVLNFSSAIFATFGAMQAAATQVGANTVITAGANTVTLNNVTKANLVAADFITH
jgi:Ca2+-binding RTX toxin-like protein